MLNVNQLRELIIKPALIDLVLFSEDALELLVFTCAIESNGGEYIKQVGGPALGIYQMEPATHIDIWQNYILKKQLLLNQLSASFDCNRMPSEDRMIYDSRYATAMARIHYSRVKSKLPSAKSVDDMWEYYKQYYNTNLGSAAKPLGLLKYKEFIR